MAGNTKGSVFFAFLVIIGALAFWPISLILLMIYAIIALISNLQSTAFSESADKWEKAHSSAPCVFEGKYGFIEGAAVNGNKLTLTIKPILALLPGSLAKSENYTIEITDGSLICSMHRLFKRNSIEILRGVSVELSAIESALKCHEQFAWCVEAMNILIKMSDQIDRALRLAPGNPLLEPSVPAMEVARRKITDESSSICKAKEFALETLNDLIDYLSIPSELRQLSEITDLESIVSVRHDDLRTSFDELLAFNNEYVKLMS